MHLVPAEGPIPYRTFYSYIAERGFPVTQFIRHGSKPEFTPEPDMIHDCLGHVPPLVNHDYAELLTLIGKAAVRVKSGDHVLALKRLSWFSVEFGLIEEAGETKIFGAGILSSMGEIPFSLSIERRAPALRHRRGDRDRLRLVAHAGTAVRDPVVPVPSQGSGAAGGTTRGVAIEQPRTRAELKFCSTGVTVSVLHGRLWHRTLVLCFSDTVLQ